MTPETAALRGVISTLLGCILGICYGFLRPLRCRRTWLADGLFVGISAWAMSYLMFAVCRGDFRFGYLLAAVSGIILWEKATAEVMQPVFWEIWKGLEKIRRILMLPGKKSLKFAKKCLHLGKNGLQ